MPSAKSRAAKSATAARIAAYHAANRVAAYEAAAVILEADALVKGSAGTPQVVGEDRNGNGDVNVNAQTPIGYQPTLPSMLNLNTSPNMNRALAVGAVVVGSDLNNPSDEENVQPVGSGMALNCVVHKGEGDGYVGRPLSPIVGNVDKEKDVRAYEIERQKVKRAGELVKRKAGKAGGGRVVSEGNGSKKEVKSRIGQADIELDMAEMIGEKPTTKISRGVDRDKVETGRIEVSLSELVMRQKKKARKVKDDDFEMISPVRAVIALDDVESREMEMDEAWEHIGSEMDKTSYAAVLVGE